MKEETAKDRTVELNKLSGLHVTGTVKNGELFFEFRLGQSVVAAFYTYKKAKAFAKGVQVAREILA